MLEKILEEIEENIEKIKENAHTVSYMAGVYKAKDMVKDIIYKHMNDAKGKEYISRQEAINAVAKSYRYESDRITALQNIPIIRIDNDGWIPCDERLPDTEHSVLMCDANGCRDVGWWTGKRWVTGFSHADIARDIIAWRPLPEPYRPKKGEED